MVILQQHKCPVCFGDTFPYFTHKDIFNNEVEIMKCKNCGHGSYHHAWTQSDFDEIYGSEYARDYLDLTETHNQRREQYVQDLALLQDFLPQKLRVLDFGCSSGEYLDSMPDNWEKSGFEVNPKLVFILKSTRPRYSIYNKVNEIEGEFNLITLRGVIEHIPEHTSLTELIKKRLQAGGLLYISATPDFSSPCATEYKDGWGQIVAPEHIHQFTPASLQILLSTCGLVMKSLYHPYMGTPYENWKSDSQLYLSNIRGSLPFGHSTKAVKPQKHPFPGNMMSAIFEKVV
jgi:SAM-dependent methyltransferase